MRRSIVLLLALMLWLSVAALAQSGGRLRGTITKEDGTPIQGMTVRLVKARWGAITKEDGSFIIRDITPGEYDITVSGVGFETYEATLTIMADSTIELNAVLAVKEISRKGVIIRCACPRIQIRYGTTHTISFYYYDPSSRETLFGGVR